MLQDSTERAFKRINLGITKVYLLKVKGGYLLIDTAYHHLYDKFLKNLNRLKIDKSEIKYLLLTHHHDDHCGFAGKLKDQTCCRIIVHEAALEYIKAGKHCSEIEPANGMIKFVLWLFSLVHGKHEYPGFSIDQNDIILTGDNFTLLNDLGIKGRIFHTPGHTADSISVLLDNGEVFVGDAVMNFLRFCGQGKKPIYIQDIDLVYKSWTRLENEGAKIIYPAHGNPFSIKKLRR